jgi:hypothetical protein
MSGLISVRVKPCLVIAARTRQQWPARHPARDRTGLPCGSRYWLFQAYETAIFAAAALPASEAGTGSVASGSISGNPFHQ